MDHTTTSVPGRDPLTRSIAEHAGWCIGVGAVLIVLGIVAILSPLASGIAVNLFVGAMFLGSGIVEVISGLRLRKGTEGRGWLIVVGFVSIATGAYLLGQPLASLLALTWILAALLMAQGVMRALSAFELRPLRGWGWMLFSAFASILLGGLLLAGWPVSGAWAIGTLFGVHLLLSGTTMLQLGIAAKSA